MNEILTVYIARDRMDKRLVVRHGEAVAEFIAENMEADIMVFLDEKTEPFLIVFEKKLRYAADKAFEAKVLHEMNRLLWKGAG